MDGSGDVIQGWLRKAGTKGLNTNAFKKKYFRQSGSELHYYENERCEESQGCINLSDVINLFPEGKPKQGVFILLTQSRAWKLSALGDEPDAARAQWMRALEAWLNENRPGFKKLKKMGFEKPTVVQGLLPSAATKRVSVADVSASSSSSPREGGAEGEKSVSANVLPPSAVSANGLPNVSAMKATALNYRRLELQIKLAQDAIGNVSQNSDTLNRVKKLEEEREEKRALAAAKELQLSELEKEYALSANVSRSDFAELLKKVSELHARLLKPGFEKLQTVFESYAEDEEPELSQEELFEFLRNFDFVLPPVEAALHLSLTLLQKDSANVLQRISALEIENKALAETLEELEAKKKEVEHSGKRLAELCSQIQETLAVFPAVSFPGKEAAVEWLKVAPEENDLLYSAIGLTAAKVETSGEAGGGVGDENLKLLLMEKLGQTPQVALSEDGSIKAATVEGLFSLLINGEGRVRHPEFEDAILFGFPSFAQPMDLLERIVLCFCATLPRNHDAPKRAEAIVEMNRRRLVTLVNRWMLLHEYHFSEKNFARFLQDFIVTVELSGLKEEAHKLREKVSANIFPFTGEYQPSILPPDLNSFQILDLAPMELARQMTRLDAALFEVIETRDFLETAWTSKNPNVATSVKAITKQFNRMSQWVASVILSEDDLRRRALVIEFFILTGEACLEINNFNGLLQIIGSLSKTEIHRLTNSWELVGREKMKLFEAHRELLQSNCNLLRQRYAAAKPPCLPYLGTYLTDLVMIAEQKTRIGDKINYRKLQLQEKCLSALVRRNEAGIKFPFREVREIRSFLLDDSRLLKTDDEMMRRSLELEPRAAEGGTAKIAKSKSVSSLIRNDSKARVIRKTGSGDRSTMQLASSPSTMRRPEEGSSPSSPSRKPSTTSVLSTSAGTLPQLAGEKNIDRGPPPPLPPTAREGSTSPRSTSATAAVSPPQQFFPSSSSVSPPAEHSSAFRTVRSGMRASSPAGSMTSAAVSAAANAAAVSSPMIGKRITPASSARGSGSGSGGGEGLSSSPESGGFTSPKLGKSGPLPAPRRDPKAPASPPTSARSPAPRKALPKPPQESGSEVSDEEEEEPREDL